MKTLLTTAIIFICFLSCEKDTSKPVAEYLAVYDAMTTKPSNADKIIQNEWLKGLIDIGVYDKAIVLDNLACPDSQSSLLNWKSPGTFNPATFQSPVFTAYKGFKGDNAGSKHVRTNFIPSTDGAGFLGQDDITVIIGVNDEANEAYSDLGGVGSSKDITIYSRNNNQLFVTLNGAANYISSKSLSSKRYFTIARNDGSNRQIYKNLVKSVQAQASVGLCSGEIWIGGSLNYDTNVSNRTISFALIFKYLTESEVQGVIKICDAYLKHYNNNIRQFQTAIDFNLVLEGHSLIYHDSYLADGIEGHSNILKSYNSAQPGDNIATMATRAATADSKLITETTTYKNILAVYCGVNDVFNLAGQGTTAYNSLKIYVQNRVNAGWKVFVFTMTPSASSGRGAQFEIERDTFNGLLRSDLSLINNVYILDTDTISELDDPNNTTYYAADKIHFVGPGALLVSQLFTDKIEELYGN